MPRTGRLFLARMGLGAALAWGAFWGAFWGAAPARAQMHPTLSIDADCSTFAISPQDHVVFAVPHLRRYEHQIVERDEIFVAPIEPKLRVKQILVPDKFLPMPPVSSYQVQALAWSPDGTRIAAQIATMKPGKDESENEDMSEEPSKKKQKQPRKKPNTGHLGATPPAVIGRQIILLQDDGRRIPIPGSKSDAIENGSSPAWLADGNSLVYLTGEGPAQIARLRLRDGQTKTLFGGHTFQTVVWDTARNGAFAISDNLSISGHRALLELDLVNETVRELMPLPNYKGELAISPQRDKAGFFQDGDTIAVYDIARPEDPARVQTGMGHFEFAADGRHILLKRGPDDQSNDLIWVGIYDGSFNPILHDLAYHDFQFSPDGNWLAVTQPGKRILQFFPMR